MAYVYPYLKLFYSNVEHLWYLLAVLLFVQVPALLNNNLEMQLISFLSSVLTEIIPNPEKLNTAAVQPPHTHVHCTCCIVHSSLCMPKVREQLYSMLHHADKALIKILQLITMMT